MAAVAERGLAGVFASAQGQGFGLCQGQFDRFETGPLMGAVAEGLAGAAAAGTPPVGSRGEFDKIGRFLGDFRFHVPRPL